jgi:hypothetical protein
MAHLATLVGANQIPVSLWQIILPPGISFYTFQEVAYIVDVYHRKVQPADSLVDYALFISLFPHLIAGPIQQPSHLLPQVQQPRTRAALGMEPTGRLWFGAAPRASASRLSDILQVKTQSHLDHTAASDYFFAHFSSWLGHRAEIRNWLLRKSLANAANLAQHVRPHNQPLPPTESILAKALPRLRAMNQLCNKNGSRFFLLIPPSLDVRDASAELQAAAAREGIMVVLPFQHAELPETAFMEGAHLNPTGAALFTERLGPRLLQTLHN